jgi:hypothetical protein
LRGCSDKDLKRIEDHVGHRLPEEYKNVMRVIGREAGDFMSDLEMFYPEVVTLTDRIRKLLTETVKLPDDAFVFVNRYGEQILFFHVSATGDDLPIYRWHNWQPHRFRKVFKSIWDFIEEELSGHEKMLRGDIDVNEG